MTEQSSIHDDCLVLDCPAYVDPKHQNFLFPDVTEDTLSSFAFSYDIEHLGPAEFPGKFPAEGYIHGLYNRLMINLVCRCRNQQSSQGVNIVFLINTASPCSYLSKKAMIALTGSSDSLPRMLDVNIHTSRVSTGFYQCPAGSGFENVNVLGMDFVSRYFMLTIDGRSGKFTLDQQ
jgi:hypothetical protein